MRTYFDDFLNVKKFKYSIFPHWYTDKKLSYLTRGFNIVDFTLILNASFSLVGAFLF